MASSAITEAFETAKREFLLNTTNSGSYDFAQFTSIDHVYNATEQIQRDQSRSGALRNLRKIQPYLQCLNHYAGVIETFAQAKPEIMSLIWGPIKTILLISSTYVRSYDKILDVMAQVGSMLPQFQNYTHLFEKNSQIKHVLCLFYRDMLDFHFTILDFFRLKKWRILFESLWPRYHGKIQVIFDNLARHRALMDSEVTLSHIYEAHKARNAAYKAYEQAQDFQQRQDFEAAMSGLSPRLYDHELEEIRRGCSVGSGKWLMTSKGYQSWLDNANQNTRLLWLQGIPGAGKTFLTSTVIRDIRAKENPLAFAFLTYQSRNQVSDLKILHSFIFQLALDHLSLRLMLCSAYNGNYRELSSSIEFNMELLKNMLEILPVTYFSVDGLDEISETERIRILETLLKLHKDHEKLKLIISSRAEQDLIHVLGDIVQPIRVHDGNSRDILAYVKDRSCEWTTTRRVCQAEAKTVQDLMNKIAEKADGMFLYAKLIFANLDRYGDIEGIKRELDDLPQGLDEAYGRIFDRMDRELRPEERLEAKTVLEWVACSIVPVSENEIELALLVSRGDNPSRGRQGLFMNIFQRCGPIIEELNGYVRFVHYTALKYLFDLQSNQYLKEMDAHANIASICLRYLSSDCFDEGISDETIEQGILVGSYVLENYSCLYWLDHVKRCAKVGAERLRTDIDELILRRSNYDFEPEDSESNFSRVIFQPFEKVSSEIFEKLLETNTFWRTRSRELCFQNGESWSCLDPFSISATQIRIRNLFEGILCPVDGHKSNCRCTALRAIFGDRLYKCSRPGCFLFRTGFDSLKESQTHSRAHDRPFKCSWTECPYAEFGFRTQALLNAHMIQRHREHQGTCAINLERLRNEDEIGLILSDAVKADDLELTRDLREEIPKRVGDLVQTAINGHVSAAMLELILSALEPESTRFVSFVELATKRKNVEAVRVLSSLGDQDPIRAWDFQGFRNARDSPEIFKYLSKIISYLGADSSTHRLLMIIPKSPDSRAEADTIECFRYIIHLVSIDFLRNCLKYVADRCCSTSIAKYFLEHGAPVEGKGILSDNYPTPLTTASKKTTREAAELMKLLIESGAEIGLGKGALDLATRAGCRNISQWFGVEWNEFVEQCRKRRTSV